MTGSPTVTITKTPDLASVDLEVSVDADKITPTVDQETGVITFAIAADQLVGDYVATITCGEADPIELPIKVTAPTNVDGLTASPTTISFTTLNSFKNFGFVLGTRFSQDPVEIENTCSEPDKIVIEDVTDTFANNTGKWTRKWRIKQTARFDERIPFTITGKCNNDTATVTVTPQ